MSNYTSALWKTLGDTISNGLKSIIADIDDLREKIDAIGQGSKKKSRLMQQVAMLEHVLQKRQEEFDFIREKLSENVQDELTAQAMATPSVLGFGSTAFSNYFLNYSEILLTDKAQEWTLLTYTYGSLQAAIMQRINTIQRKDQSPRAFSLEIADIIIGNCYQILAKQLQQNSFAHLMLTDNLLRPIPYFEKRDIEYPLELGGIILTSGIGIPSSTLNAPWNMISAIHEIAHDFDHKFALSAYYLRNYINESLKKNINETRIQELVEANQNLVAGGNPDEKKEQIKNNDDLIKELAKETGEFDPEIKQIWLGWLGEIFADVIGTLFLGPAYVRSLLAMLLQIYGQDIQETDDGIHPQAYIRGLISITTLKLIAGEQGTLQDEAKDLDQLWRQKTFIPKIETVLAGPEETEYTIEEIAAPMETYLRLILDAEIMLDEKNKKALFRGTNDKALSLKQIFEPYADEPDHNAITIIAEKLLAEGNLIDAGGKVVDTDIKSLKEKNTLKYPLYVIAAAYRAWEQNPEKLDTINQNTQALLKQVITEESEGDGEEWVDFILTEECITRLRDEGSIGDSEETLLRERLRPGPILARREEEFAKRLDLKPEVIRNPRFLDCTKQVIMLFNTLKDASTREEGLGKVLKKMVPFLAPALGNRGVSSTKNRPTGSGRKGRRGTRRSGGMISR